MRQAVAILVIVVAGLMPAFCADAEVLTGPALVIDGDSIVILGERIHILDVDAPENAQFCFKKAESLEQGAWHCGQDAAHALADLIGRQNVTCDTAMRGTHSGWLARCTVGGEDLARWLAASGWAVPSHSCKCEIVRSAAGRAKSAQLGIWSSAFTMPWDWRKAH